jgi:hypothetical protein
VGIYAHRWMKLTSLAKPGKRFEAWYERLTDRPAFQQRAMLPMT